MAEPLLYVAELPVLVKGDATGDDPGSFEIELFRALHVSHGGWFTDPMGARLFDGDKVAYFLDNHDENLKLGYAGLHTTPEVARLVNGKWFSTDYAQAVRRECLEVQAAGMTIKASVGMLVEPEDVEVVNSADGLVVPYPDSGPPFTYFKRAVVTEGSRVIAGKHPSAHLRVASMRPEDVQVRNWYKRAFAGATPEEEIDMSTEFKAAEESGEATTGARLELTAEATQALAAQIVPAVVEAVVPAVAAAVVPAVTNGVAEHLAAALNAAIEAQEEPVEEDEVTASLDALVAEDDVSGIDLLAFQTASLHPSLRKVISDVDAHVGGQRLS